MGTISQSLLTTPVASQVTSDGTTSTQVTENGNVSTINGGVTNGDNLFHSFQDFSVGTGSEAFFNNAPEIGNILSRVTGGNISNIDGLIRNNGNANLFLINPAGIIFGENARLDLGGSFYGSTASSILFEDGEFSVTDLDNPPLLTVNAPIGLSFRENPASIIATGNSENSLSLVVETGESFNLIGGEINLSRGEIVAEEGTINFASIAQEGTISFSEDNSLNTPTNTNRDNIILDNFVLEIVPSISDGDSGNINISTQSLSLTNNSILINNTFNEGNAGEVNLNATDSILINSGSTILTDTFAEGNAGNIFIQAGNNFILEGINQNLDPEISASASFLENIDIPGNLSGNAGNIEITAANISLNNSAQVVSNTFGSGNAGNVSFNADSINIANNSSVFSAVGSLESNIGATGNGGTIDFATRTLSLSDGGTIIVQTFGLGNAGTININAADSINISGVANFPLLENGNPGGFSSGLFSNSEVSALGSGGEITVTTSTFNISGGAVINARSRGIASAGNVFINADILEITNGSQILATAFNDGAAGNINLDISQRILISGIDPNYSNRLESLINNFDEDIAQFTIDPVSADSGIFANTTFSAIEGTTGDITIQVGDRLELRNGSLISAQASNVTNGGNIAINSENGFVVAFPSNDLGGDIVANAPEGAGGNITIMAQGVLGLEENIAFDNAGNRLNNSSNDLDATGDVDGAIQIITPNVDVIQGIPQLSLDVFTLH
nr:filamentous hemagglutinin N-terminal domain-containing protein [Waterburya agarophytonicola]